MTNPENREANMPVPHTPDVDNTPNEMLPNELINRIMLDRYGFGSDGSDEFRRATWNSLDLMTTCNLAEKKSNGMAYYLLNVSRIKEEDDNSDPENYAYFPLRDSVHTHNGEGYKPVDESEAAAVHEKFRQYLQMGYDQTRSAKVEVVAKLVHEKQEPEHIAGFAQLMGPVAVRIALNHAESHELLEMKKAKEDSETPLDALAVELYQVLRSVGGEDVRVDFDTFHTALKDEIQQNHYQSNDN